MYIFGLPHDTAHALLNIAGAAIKSGRTFDAELAYDDFLEGYDCVLKHADARWHDAFVRYGIWFYKRHDFPLMQLFWPDREGVLPWKSSASDWQRANQPLLNESGIDDARRQTLLDSMDMSTD